MVTSVFRFVSTCAGIVGVCVLLMAGTAAAADVTIGADVTQTTSESGTCGFEHSTERPCTIVTNAIPGGPTLASPCDGTVTRFRLNGFPRPANSYSLRVVRRNSDGSYTGTATSAPVTIAAEGVNEYTTDLPIAAGELLGIDFLDSTEEHGLRWVGGGPAVSAAVLFDFPADGSPAFANIPATTFYYLFNGDISCGSTAPPSPPAPATTVTPPSNAFRILKRRQTTLTLALASPGTISVADAGAKRSASAVSASKAERRLLKPSSARGGPGRAKIKLALTGAAKAKLGKTGKLRVRARITFTPNGGSAAGIVRSFTLRRSDAGGGKRR